MTGWTKRTSWAEFPWARVQYEHEDGGLVTVVAPRERAAEVAKVLDQALGIEASEDGR